ncbi:tetratricopeptide repeat protein [Umezawaea endophytica]|uniref:Tetratricopeptide repeat protein n=1 Tax=Umezawaea endophytica TaxID=1654476 RepID=A0A9X2VQB0_9PSEU|nr:tetratricopeptide repeat protein [Umezawaea endophytica]MCS7480369.1 tetratricopeptide repeat protein [Umezawaea endophytica]
MDSAARSIGFLDDQARNPSPTNAAALAALERDHVGAVSTIEAAIAHELWTDAVSLASAMIPVLQHLGRWDGLVRAADCLRVAGERTGNVQWLTAGLLNLGSAASHRGDIDLAVDRYRQCFEAAAAAGEHTTMALARSAYGGLLLDAGRSRDAIDVIRGGLPIWRWAGDDLRLATALSDLGKANVGMARWRRAEQYFRNAQAVARRGRLGALLPSFGVLLAESLRLAGRLTSASRECEEALDRARAVGDRAAEADALRQVALIRQAVDETESRIDPLTDALAIYRESGDVKGEIATLHMLGQAVGHRDQAESARYYGECVERATTVGDLVHLANALAELGGLHAAAGDHLKAEDCFRRAVDVAEHSGNEFLLMQVSHERAKVFRHTGRVDQAVPLLRRNVAIFERNGESPALSTARALLGEALIHHGDWKEAARVLRTVADAPHEITHARTRASAFRHLATLYSRRGLWDEAVSSVERALVLADESGVEEERMDCLLTKGTVLARMSHWEEAVAAYRIALALAVERRAVHTQLVVQGNLATCLHRAGSGEESVLTLRASLESARKVGVKDLEASIRNNLGAILAEQGDADAAVVEFEHARTIACELGNKSLIADALLNLARAHLARTRFDEAARCAHEARLLRQEAEEWRPAANALKVEATALAALAVAAGKEPDQVPLPDDVAPMVLATMRSKYVRAEYSAPQPESEPQFDRRRIVVSQDVVDRYGDVPLDQVLARLGTDRRHCVSCGLPLAANGVAHVVLLSNQGDGPDGMTLAHPTCAPPSVVRVEQLPDRHERVRLEIECTVWGDDVAGVVVDARGPWAQREDGVVSDIFIESLRQVGFTSLGDASAIEQVTRSRAGARLVGNRMEIIADGAELVALPLSFYPRWYQAARKGAVIAMFGHDLRGMVADSDRYLVEAMRRGNVVAAALELVVVPPGRNQSCVCSPSTGLKYKKCCGKR